MQPAAPQGSHRLPVLRLAPWWIYLLAALLNLAGRTSRGGSIGGDFEIVHDALSAGGGRSTSAIYSAEAELGGIGDRAEATALVNESGHAGQINYFPAVGNDSFSSLPNISIEILSERLILNDGDPDGDPLRVIAVGVSRNTAGTIEPTARGAIYHPPGDFVGDDELLYVIADSRDGVATGVVTIHLAKAVPEAPADTTSNKPPIAPPQTFVRAPGLTLKIRIADLLAASSDPDGGTPALTGVGSSGQGATISTISTHILYNPVNVSNDSFTYTISDGQGGTATGTITVQVVNPGGLIQTITSMGGSVTIHFAGIPGYAYDIQRAPALGGPWTTLATQTAPANGLFSHMETPPGLPSFYRLRQH